MGEGVFVCVRERRNEGGGTLSEAHNLIIHSIEWHIHFIVPQISPNSSRALRVKQSRFMFSKEIAELISQELHSWLFS